MIRLSEIGGLYQSTPANQKDARTKAFMYACDKQISKLLEYAEKTKVWCDIESVDGRFLDHMAAESQAMFYNPSLSTDVKRKLIINSQYWHMKLGTSQAMEEMISIVFSDPDASIAEWYEYGGKPYTFKVTTGAEINYESVKEFEKLLAEVKNARSVLENIELIRKINMPLRAGMEIMCRNTVNIGWGDG